MVDHLKHAVDPPRIVHRRATLTNRRDGSAEYDGADHVHRNGDQLGALDPSVTLKRVSHGALDCARIG